MKKKDKVFLYGYYGTNNAGDDLLLNSIIKKIKLLSSNKEFIVKCLNIPNIETKNNVEFIQIEKLIIDREKSKLSKFLDYAKEAWKSLSGCEIFIFGGGTLFHARNNSNINLILILMWVVFAKIKGMKVYALGVGVSPISATIPRVLLGAIIYLSKDFAVRDYSSYRYAKKNDISDRVRLTSDLIFSENYNLQIKSQKSNIKVVAVTLAASDIDAKIENNKKIINELNLVLEILKEKKWEVQFFIFQDSEKDQEISDNNLFNILQKNTNLEYKRVKINSFKDIIEMAYSQINLVIGMRFHSLILAAKFGKPFIGLSNDGKVINVCEKFRMPCFQLNDINHIKIINSINELENNMPDKLIVKSEEDKAEDNYLKIKEDMK